MFLFPWKFSLNNLGASGRYVRIQAIGNTIVKLAEVEVIGKSIINTTPTIPNPPSDLIATEVDCNTIDLTWVDNSNDEINFKIMQSINGSAYSLYQTLDANVTSFSAIGLDENTEYGFRVKAYNTAGNSSASQSNLITTSSCPSVSEISVVHDAHVRNGSYKNDNFGSAANLQIRQKNGSSLKRQAYLMFDISSLSSITSATLRFKNTGNDGSVDIHEVNDDNWNESTITWQNKPSVNGYIGSVSFNGIDTYDIDVTNYVSNEINNDGTVTFAIKGLTDNYMTISSKEGDFVPVLVINESSTMGKMLSDKKHNGTEHFNEVKLYPNPTKNIVTLSFMNLGNQAGQVSIYNSVGQLVLEKKILNVKQEFEIEGAPGLYFVKIEANGKSIVKKLIKE